MPPENEDDRYHRVLREFEAFTRETQAYRARTEQALDDLGVRLTTFWGATAAGMRQLSTWFAETEDRAAAERAEERAKRERRDRIIIALLLVSIGFLGISLGILLWVFR